MNWFNKLVLWWKAIPAESLDKAFDRTGFYLPEWKPRRLCECRNCGSLYFSQGDWACFPCEVARAAERARLKSSGGPEGV